MDGGMSRNATDDRSRRQLKSSLKKKGMREFRVPVVDPEQRLYTGIGEARRDSGRRALGKRVGIDSVENEGLDQLQVSTHLKCILGLREFGRLVELWHRGQQVAVVSSWGVRVNPIRDHFNLFLSQCLL